MHSPFETFEHLKESLAAYLETAYKISEETAYRQRGDYLRRPQIVAQDPFIESTPSFPAASLLRDLIAQGIPPVPELSELAAFGMPVQDFPLYDHQADALRAASGGSPNLVIATGTGSGKTEAFLLPIFADILREARAWPAPRRAAQPGTYNSAQQQWLHGRLHEQRSAATRAIILYPMNALVNDQLQRLRRFLGSEGSEAWQRSHLSQNCIHFGMYTGDAEPTGHWSKSGKRVGWSAYQQSVAATWQSLSDENRRRGTWPRPNSPEMLCRWDMQYAPPDVLVTNYSMLEYMLVRPIEAQIFELTKRWLQLTPGAHITLVLDEAHTYTGARGTEIAHLIRRLKERLGISTGDGKMRCIATSASLPVTQAARDNIRAFAASLFGEAESSFTTIVSPPVVAAEIAPPTLKEMHAFSSFATQLEGANVENLAGDLASALGRPRLSTGSAASRLHTLLRDYPLVIRARDLTARNATQLDTLATKLWGDLGDNGLRRNATAGIFAAGALARERDLPDVPPLISSRVHMMFRGIAGIWACLDPACAQLEPPPASVSRIVGRFYVEPTPWCACGARVLEIFTCRICGWMCAGGIADSAGGLWPWADDLEGGRADYTDFTIFGLEAPHYGAVPTHRSFHSTTIVTANSADARPAFEITGATVAGAQIPFPSSCPRCANRRGQGADGREIIEPLRTKGSKSFSAILEDAYRLQPAHHTSSTANAGRKALAFSDSRQDAAMLAGDLEIDHNRDLFRQICFRLLYACPNCHGFGTMLAQAAPLFGNPEPGPPENPLCTVCAGTGLRTSRSPIAVGELRTLAIGFAHRARIDPTLGGVANYFAQLSPFFNPNEHSARLYVNSFLRNEIAARDFGLEPMGLAAWRAIFPPGVIGSLQPLTNAETDDLVESVTRLLATEDVLLPPSLDLSDWADDWIVPAWDRKVVGPPDGPPGNHIVRFDLTGRGKLGRYARSIAASLCRQGRLSERDAEDWPRRITPDVLNVLRQLQILTPDSRGLGFGTNIDRFQLEPMLETVHVCSQCAYVSNRAVVNTCMRCGSMTELRPIDHIRNYYRNVVEAARPGSNLPDPFSLKVFEHSAQIEKAEARRFELRFQDVFVNAENPDDARIDILSVTTTMEMGIDIGSLLSVGLRNVPPTVANYQQRAGRAGRRGTGVATVVTYAQNRSHDQYYFQDPPSIVTAPPRVPRLYLDNEVIARRHVRATVLHYFFSSWPPTAQVGNVGGLLNAWGDIRHFTSAGGQQALDSFVRSNNQPLSRRCEQIVHRRFAESVSSWVAEIPAEVQAKLRGRPASDDVLGSMLDSGYLPRHAFPIDVVSLWTESAPSGAVYRERGIQRDLGIALSEFAPGAEVVRNKRIFRVAGLYDPYAFGQPNYLASEKMVECLDCRSIQLESLTAPPQIQCRVCGGIRITTMPFVRPPGFCSDWSGPDARGRPYRGGGRERGGYSTPARLTIGEYALTSVASSIPSCAPNLRVLVRNGDLHIVNRGADNQQPGFRLCPQCGRALELGSSVHTYPADIPPHYGPARGPRAGQQCPNANPTADRVLLGYRFPSDVLQLGVDLPTDLDADIRTPAGRAVWLSFATLVQNAAARVLQINPEELRAGVRSISRPNGRVHGEAFLYDALPGGAGYARDIETSLDVVLQEALENASHCSNTECTGACYSCLLDYQNQQQHPLLDRGLGRAVLEYLLSDTRPALSQTEADTLVQHLVPFLGEHLSRRPGRTIAGYDIPLIVENARGEQIGVLPRHTLQAPPPPAAQQQFLIQGLRVYSITAFDLERRPLWVVNQIDT